MAIDGSRIQRITKEGLFYLDDEGKEVFIDFEACHELWFAKAIQRFELQKSREQNPKLIEMYDRSIRWHIKHKKTYMPVAEGCLSGFTSSGLLGFRFYTEPLTHIEFETEDGFDQVRAIIEDYGWKIPFFNYSGTIQHISPNGLLYTNHDDEEIFIDFAAIQDRNSTKSVGKQVLDTQNEGLIFFYLNFYTLPRVYFHEFWQSAKEIVDTIEQYGWKIDRSQ